MTTIPWPDVLARLDSLNDPQAPFSYAVDGDAIVGTWDIAKIRMLGLTVASHDDSYRIVIRPEETGVYDWKEHRHTTRSSVGSSGGSLSSRRFSGKSKSISFGFRAGAAGTSKGEPANTAGWSFSDDEIKRPVMDYLASMGWNRKKGLLNRLFG
ncbi:MAG: hypothetical protein ACK5LS_06490 [Propioniciclava sp.]